MTTGLLHDLVLSQAAVGVSVHDIVSTLIQVLDKAQVERTATVLVTLELGDGRLSGVGTVEANHTSASGTATGLVLNLSLLNLSDGCEQLDQIIVAGRPGQL